MTMESRRPGMQLQTNRRLNTQQHVQSWVNQYTIPNKTKVHLRRKSMALFKERIVDPLYNPDEFLLSLSETDQ